MTAISKTQITHESETQRQYPRFAMPARVTLATKDYAVKNLSVGGCALTGVEEAPARGKTLTLGLKLAFGGFALGVPLNAEAQYYDAATRTLGCRFVNLTGEQTSFLNHVVKSFVAGDIVTAGSLLNVAQRNNYTPARAHANTNRSGSDLRRQLPGLLIVFIIGIITTALIAGNLYNNLFVAQAEDATVAAATTSVRAASTGVFTPRLDAGVSLVQQNQALGLLKTAGGTVTLQSPCNCYIIKAPAASGALIAEGDALYTLVPVDATPWVVAAIDPAQARKIGPDSTATISVFGAREKYTGKIVSMESALAGPRNDGGRTVLARIAPDQKLPVNFVNRLAAVTFSIH